MNLFVHFGGLVTILNNNSSLHTVGRGISPKKVVQKFYSWIYYINKFNTNIYKIMSMNTLKV